MSDTKISALTSATTPLAGTEVLPIVQSSTTVKVAVNDLTVRNIRAAATTGILQVSGPTAGTTRTVTVPDANYTVARTDAAQSFTGDQTLSTGNLIQGTAAKGMNFTANTPAAGMTSQLLNWYEEGTYTPTTTNLTVITGSANWSGKYTRVGRLMTAYFIVTGGNFTITQGSTTISLPKAATGYETGLIVNPNTGVGNIGFGVASGNSFGYVGTTATGTGFSGSVTYIV